MNYVNGAKKVFNAAEMVREFKTNTGSVKGNLKNATNVAMMVPGEPVTKIVVFFIVLFLPVILLFFFLAGFCIVLFGSVAAIIIVQDIPIDSNVATTPNKATSDSDSGNKGTSDSGNTGVAKGMEGKLLLPKGMWNVTDCFGCRSGGTHYGLDLQYTAASIKAGYDDWGVYPAYPGVVTKVGSHPSFGNHVFIKHDMGDGKTLYTLYGHMMYTKVKVGQKVGYNTFLGKIGNTGLVSLSHTNGGSWCQFGCNVHLHMEVHTGDFNGVMNKGTQRPPGNYITCEHGALGNSRGDKTACAKFRDKKVKSLGD